MSEQPALASPSGPEPSPYDAPAYGDVAGEPAPGTEPTWTAPPTTPFGAPPPPPAGSGYGASAQGAYGGAPGATPWAPYPVAPQGASPYQVDQRYVAFGAPTHQLATTSLVLGIIGIAGILLTPIFLVTLLAGGCSPFAIWLGVRARREIRANPRQYGGEGWRRPA
ncbi:MAG TPA: hypothetical protein VNT31_11310 [Nocardioides sp.]|nr:hypothetical protein [Nocardioides sp.]